MKIKGKIKKAKGLVTKLNPKIKADQMKLFFINKYDAKKTTKVKKLSVWPHKVELAKIAGLKIYKEAASKPAFLFLNF